MRYIGNFLRNPTEFFKDERNQKILILSVFVFLFLCSLILLVRSAPRRGEEAVNIDNTATSVSMTSTITPTKWWIKMTATSSPAGLGLSTSTGLAESSASNCPSRFSSPLKANIYAYISLTPPLPNRIRSAAGLSNTYLGQIEPGGGLKLIDGPICADGYSWWLVESLHGGLRGWTVEGKSSEQWVLRCPNKSMACSQTVAPLSSDIASENDTNKDKNDCESDKFAVGMFAQAGQDSLLVLRSEPYTGGVNGRAGPMSIVKVIEGPTCAGSAVWWKLNVFDLDLVGWATENDLYACPKDSECNLGAF
jgi:hypothetical protein